MNTGRNIPLYIIAVFAWIIINSSCANQGMPTGGPMDSIPPVLLNAYPKYGAVDFEGEEVRLTFNEYIVPDEVREQLVVSPPLQKRPTILTKSRTLIVQFNEELKDSTTYSLDFKNSVADNNERNELKNLRHAFSTGNVFDTLRVAGQVVNAFNLEAKENVLVMLYRNLHDSAVYTLLPDYIARTDEEGLFFMDNIAPGTYDIYSITDNNNNLMYDEGSEEIAFVLEEVNPSAEFHETQDTLVTGVDSLLVTGHTHFYPDPFFLRQFKEDLFDQYLDSYKRNSPYQLTVVLNESVEDTFSIKLLNAEAQDWYILEHNEEMDSLTFWLTDTTLIKMDTLVTELAYFELDSADQLYVKHDTVEFTFTVKEESVKKRKRQAEEEEEAETEPVPQFAFNVNIGSGPFGLNDDIIIVAPEPLQSFDSTQVSLYLMNDSLRKPLAFNFIRDTSQWRTYRIEFDWEPETAYTFRIDSAAGMNIYGLTNSELIKKFETREEDYYGAINLSLTGIEDTVVIQLLDNTDDERVLMQKQVTASGQVVFDFLPPLKYRLKAIYDRNGNGEWDEGSFQEKILPEKVAYINEVIKIRSNWDNAYNWELSEDTEMKVKEIRDPEVEEEQRKEELKKRQQEQQFRESPQQNNPLRGGTSPYMNR